MAQQDVSMPVHYSRYVDDIFCVFNSLEYLGMFLCFLNNMHSNLKLTCEIGPRKLAFQVTQKISLSSNNDLSLITSAYRKPTDTKSILNFHAVCPWILKSGLIKCFLNRAFTVCINCHIAQHYVVFCCHIVRSYSSIMLSRRIVASHTSDVVSLYFTVT